MSTHDMAILTYEELKKRRASKRKIQEKMVDTVHYSLTEHCARLGGSRHKGRSTKYITY